MATPWIDLSPYGLTLMVGVIDPPQPPLPPRILTLAGDASAHSEALGRVGFVLEPASGRWVHLGQFSFDDILGVFPEGHVIPDADMRQFARRLSVPAVRTPAAAEPAAAPPAEAAPPAADVPPVTDEERARTHLDGLLAQSRPLGLNRLGQRVWENPRGRFVLAQDGSGKPAFEDGTAAAQPGLFLRATDEIQLGVAADGFVEEAAQGQVLRFVDLKRFASAAFGGDPGDADPCLLRAHLAVEAAMARWLAARKGKTMADIFHGAQKLHEAFPYRGDLSRRVPGAEASVPLPVAVAVQRALGTDADLQGKRVVFAGGGAMFAHVSRDADLRVHAGGPAQAAAVRATLASCGLRADALVSGGPDWAGSDFGAASFVPGLLERPASFDGGLTVSRSDMAAAIASLGERATLGRTALVLRHGNNPEAVEEMERVREWIGARYAIEGCADIAGPLHAGNPEASPMRVLVVGRRRPFPMDAAPEPAMRRTEVADFPSLWTWTTQLVYARAKIEEYHVQLEAQQPQLGGEADPELQENSFQAPYVSLSGVGQASTMVPRNLEGATREALAHVARGHGDTDQWVSNELGMTREQLGERFSPEQVDAIALYMHAEDRGRACLMADQQGVGKGRILAAIMRRAVLQGKKVLFLTERELNISDIWRDIRHIGADGDFTPLILNDGSVVVDEMTGDATLRAPRRDYTMERIASRQWPEEHNLIIGTYSQFNKPGVPPARQRRRGRNAEQAAEALANGADGGAAVQEQAAQQPGDVALAALPPPEGAAQQPAQQPDDGTSPKSVWLRHVIDRDTILVLDECHNAAGNSNASANIAAALQQAGGVVFSSATYAKRANNMGIYAALLPPEFTDTANLTAILRKGGESMQETFATMLVKDGVMVRREHDLSKCEFRVVNDDGHAARNQRYMDQLAPVLAEMAYLSGDLDRRVNERNEAIERDLRRRGADDRQVNRKMRSLQMSRIGFGSPLYNLSRLFLCSLLVDKAVELSVDALRNGRKPIILLEHTIQGLMHDMAADEDEDEGAAAPDFKDLMRRVLGQVTRASRATRQGRVSDDLAEPGPGEVVADTLAARTLELVPAEVTGADADGAVPHPNHREAVLNAMLAAAEAMLAERPEDADAVAAAIETVRGIAARLPEDPRQAAGLVRRLGNMMPDTPARAVARIRAMIDTLPALPASAIDTVRERVEAEGARLFAAGEIERPWRVEEITGRSMEYRDGSIAKRPETSKVAIKNRFNSGETHMLIINNAGTTGIDLHAGQRFLCQEQRVMIELEAIADITKEIQAFGRVCRFDQVIGPQILSLMAGLPMEMRLVAMRNAKLRRLSANITSNREHSALIDSIPDLMNSVGDMVCSRYAEARPDLMRRLGYDVERNLRVEDRNRNNDGEAVAEDRRDNERSANEFLARLAMLSVAQQRQTLDELEAEYRATIQELDARGENPLKSHVVEGTVHMRERTVFEGAEVENPTSEFHRPVYAQKIWIEHAVEPLRSAQVAQECERGMMAMAADGLADIADRLERGKERMLQTYLPLELSVPEALAAGNHRVLNMMNERTGRLIAALRTVTAGSCIKLSLDGVIEDAVVTRVVPPDPRYMHLASAYDVRLAVPGWSRIQTMTMQTLLYDPDAAAGMAAGEDAADRLDAVLRSFDEKVEGSRLESRTILVGNDWEAMNLSVKHKLGSMVSWEDEAGVRHRGVLVSKRHRDLDFMPVSLRSAAMAAAAMVQNNSAIEIFGNSDMSPAGVMVQKNRRDHARFAVTMPQPSSRKYGFVYEHAPVQHLMATRNIAEHGKAPKFSLSADELETFFGHLIDSGVRLFAPSRHRTWANTWMAQNYGQGGAQGPDQDRDPGQAPVRAAA